jgi:hypothetical protein
MGARVFGKIELKIDSQIYAAKGSFSYGLGKDEREAVVGSDGVHGYKLKPTIPFIEGEISDAADLSLDTLAAITDATVTLTLANGKVISLNNSWTVCKDGLTASTEEGAIAVRFEGLKAEEIR